MHTPASAVQGYGGDSDEVWERFIGDLESLPAEFAVLGINDYLFIDGYRRLLDAKDAGRLSNIETLLPVIEFRLAKFAGHDKMLRLNYHIILSEALSPDVIEGQFLAQLRAGLNVSAEHASVAKQWNATVTRSSLADLGQLIRQEIPEDHADEFDESDFMLGFNNLNFNEAELVTVLENSYLRGKYVTAIGKTEWDQYRWNDHSIADKKNVINSVDIVFTAAEDLHSFRRGHGRLKKEGVKSTLFDCSDAHTYVETDKKDRIGNCLTWVKGDTTLDGLILAVKDYPDRVFTGPRPPLLSDIERHPAKYIRRLRINKRTGAHPGGKWFDSVDIPMNPELVAVIGNRGMGKSALLDCVALAGNAPRASSELSFLKPFQAARPSLADKFEVTLDWYTEEQSNPKGLDSSWDPTLPLRVRHLPQHFIDNICNKDNDQFVAEIERVVFSHVPEEERLGFDSLSELIAFRMDATQQESADIRLEVHALNERVAALESELSPKRASQLEALLGQKLEELRGMLSKRPTIPPAPQTTDPNLDTRLAQLRANTKALAAQVVTSEKKLGGTRVKLESARRVLALVDKIERDVDRLSTEHGKDFEAIGIPFDQVVSLAVKREAVRDIERALTRQLEALRTDLDEEQEESLAARLAVAQVELKTAEEALSAPMQVYQAARQAHSEFRASVREVIGATSVVDSIRYLQHAITRIETEAPQELGTHRATRIEKVRELFERHSQHLDLLRELYAPVKGFIDRYPPDDEAFEVDFSASLEPDGFADGLFSHLANNKRGSFYGAEQATVRVNETLAGTDFGDWDSVAAFLDSMHDAIHHDLRGGENRASRDVSDQVRPGSTPVELYDYIYQLQYVSYMHHLTMGGRSLLDLSPGEKGALLLVFYLLVDQSNCPLLIDQPEENLDNQSVFRMLVPFIKEARRRRQVLLVTHNPNIAVVAGAEQVIFCEMDKGDGFALAYTSGALENPLMNQRVLDVLEGTRPAFVSRDETYRVSESPRRAR